MPLPHFGVLWLLVWIVVCTLSSRVYDKHRYVISISAAVSQEGSIVITVMNAHCVSDQVPIGYNTTVKRVAPCAASMVEWGERIYGHLQPTVDKILKDLQSSGWFIENRQHM